MSALLRFALRRWSARTELLRAAWLEYEHDYARYFAGAMVYYALVSFLPLMLLALAVLGLLLRLSELAVTTRHSVLTSLEASFGTQLRASVESLLEHLEQGSVIATIVSVIGLLLAGSALVRHLRMTFRAIWQQAPILASGSVRGAMRATVLERIIAYTIVIGGGTLLLCVFLALGVFHWLLARFDTTPLLGPALSRLLPLLSPLVIAPLTFAALLAVLPPVTLRWRHLWLAALLAGLAWTVGAEVLALYVAYFGGKFSAYGAVGGVLMFMLWIHKMSQVLFFAGELCKVTHRRELSPPAAAATHVVSAPTRAPAGTVKRALMVAAAVYVLARRLLASRPYRASAG